jgi:hypothetical protein
MAKVTTIIETEEWEQAPAEKVTLEWEDIGHMHQLQHALQTIAHLCGFSYVIVELEKQSNLTATELAYDRSVGSINPRNRKDDGVHSEGVESESDESDV